MIELLSVLAAVAFAFGALMPVLKTGGQMIAAFMWRRHVLHYSAATVAQTCALFAGALLAVTIVRDSSDALLRLLAAITMLATIHAADWLIRKTLLKDLL